MKNKNLFYTLMLVLFAIILNAANANAQNRSRNTRVEKNGRNDRYERSERNNKSGIRERRLIENDYNFSHNVHYVPRYSVFKNIFRKPFKYIRLTYGGNPYYYNNGLFYTGYGTNYNLIRPPFGIRLGILPRGYWALQYGGYPYYYYSGVFYKTTDNNEYEVVQAPLGALIPELPKDAKQIVVNGQVFYEYLGTYYKEVLDEQGKVQFVVQGKDGVLNTNPNP